MALGCPVIARGIPGNLDLIQHGETGLIFETQEVSSHDSLANLTPTVRQNNQAVVWLSP